MNIFKRIQLFFTYRKIINSIKDKLLVENNLRIDRVYRLYTVINMPDDVENYGGKLGKKYVEEYLRNIDQIFVGYGLYELVGILELKKLEGNNVLVVIGFKFLNTQRIANYLLFIAFIALISTFLIFFL
jgi:hypothetical protein